MQRIFEFLNKNKYIVFFSLYLIARVLLLNVNSAEWGDTYRILRASNYLQQLTYPNDEKRPMLFSALLTIRFVSDQVESGRITMLILSILTVFAFYLLIERVGFNLTVNQKFLALILFALNPLFLYWSLRIYADTLFLFFSLIAFVIFYDFIKKQSYLKLVGLAVISILAILTRFEGYILFFALFLGLLITLKNKIPGLVYLVLFSIFFSIVISNNQIFFYQSPLNSSYVDEANSRTLSIKEILNFSLQLIFVLGNLFTFYFLAFSKNKIIDFVKKNLVLFFAFGAHLALAFIWYAAVPRLFLPILPLIIILFVISIDEFFSRTKKVSFSKYLKSISIHENLHYLIPVLLLAVYILGQKYLKLQFLLTKTTFFGVVILVSLLMIPLIYFHFKKTLITLIISLNILWAGMFIYLEKDSLKVVNIGAKYLKENFPSGVVLTNDISSISRFYFAENFKYSSKLESGKNFENEIKDSKARYVLITNEHNPDLSFTPAKHPYIEVIGNFSETISGVTFFTIIGEVKSK